MSTSTKPLVLPGKFSGNEEWTTYTCIIMKMNFDLFDNMHDYVFQSVQRIIRQFITNFFPHIDFHMLFWTMDSLLFA